MLSRDKVHNPLGFELAIPEAKDLYIVATIHCLYSDARLFLLLVPSWCGEIGGVYLSVRGVA